MGKPKSVGKKQVPGWLLSQKIFFPKMHFPAVPGNDFGFYLAGVWENGLFAPGK